MKEGSDGLKITFYDVKNLDCCSLVIEGFHRFYLCNKGKRLEISEHEIYDMIKGVLEEYYLENGEEDGL